MGRTPLRKRRGRCPGPQLAAVKPVAALHEDEINEIVDQFIAHVRPLAPQFFALDGEDYPDTTYSAQEYECEYFGHATNYTKVFNGQSFGSRADGTSQATDPDATDGLPSSSAQMLGSTVDWLPSGGCEVPVSGGRARH